MCERECMSIVTVVLPSSFVSFCLVKLTSCSAVLPLCTVIRYTDLYVYSKGWEFLHDTSILRTSPIFCIAQIIIAYRFDDSIKPEFAPRLVDALRKEYLAHYTDCTGRHSAHYSISPAPKLPLQHYCTTSARECGTA